jgi:hypothetical protein
MVQIEHEAPLPVDSSNPKTVCSACSRKLFCQRVHRVLAALAVARETHKDLEYQIRFRSLLQELVRLGFDYPEGHAVCELARIGTREAKDLLREAQELLMEVRDASHLDAIERRSV